MLFRSNCSGIKNKSNDEDLPNIVLIIGDDHGYPYFGFMGANYVSTPNMDSLANSGILFTNGYVPDNHCRPTLQSLVTGTLPIDYAQKVKKIKLNEMKKKSFAAMSKKDQELAKYHEQTELEKKAEESGFSLVELDGKFISWYGNGQILKEENYKDGKKDGKFTLSHDNGQIKLEENYKDGKKDGKWTWWNKNGQKVRQENFTILNVQ